MKKNPLYKYTAYSFAPHDDETPTQVPGGRSMSDDDPTIVQGGGRESDPGDTVLGVGQKTEIYGGTILDNQQTSTLAILWFTNGERRGHIFPIKEGDWIGRRDGEPHILDDPRVSTPHVRFRREKKKFMLWDCGSKYGTFVNKKRIRCATVLEENDLIKIGDTVFVWKVI